MIDHITHEEEYKGYKIEIRPDDCDESPRNWNNICIFHTAHRRYNIGDKNYSNGEEIHEAKKEALRRGDILLPLYMYDHSGITIALAPFGCRWDSGIVGFVVVPRLKMIEEFGKKYFTPKLKARAHEVAKSEVDTLDQFIRGDVYGYQILGKKDETMDEDDDCNERAELDSCWGFYGEEYCITEAKSIVDSIVEKADNENS